MYNFLWALAKRDLARCSNGSKKPKFVVAVENVENLFKNLYVYIIQII